MVTGPAGLLAHPATLKTRMMVIIPIKILFMLRIFFSFE
jgi:hypothetical protein